jgi:hypothetical protein
LFGSKDANTKESEKGALSVINKFVIKSNNVALFLLFRSKDANSEEFENKNESTIEFSNKVYNVAKKPAVTFNSKDRPAKSTFETRKFKLTASGSVWTERKIQAKLTNVTLNSYRVFFLRNKSLTNFQNLKHNTTSVDTNYKINLNRVLNFFRLTL